MKKTIEIINYVFTITFVICFLMMIIAIAYTFIDLYQNSYFDMSSKDSIKRFFESFNWCKPIISSVFVMLSMFYAFQTFKIHNENKLFNNYITPKEKILNDKLIQIKEINKKLHDFIISQGRNIMIMIICKESNNNIKSKGRLEHYFNKYFKSNVRDFEHSGHFGRSCRGDCNSCGNDKNVTYRGNSFKHLKLIAFDLFCISFEYLDFESDLEKIYNDGLNSHKKVNG